MKLEFWNNSAVLDCQWFHIALLSSLSRPKLDIPLHQPLKKGFNSFLCLSPSLFSALTGLFSNIARWESGMQSISLHSNGVCIITPQRAGVSYPELQRHATAHTLFLHFGFFFLCSSLHAHQPNSSNAKQSDSDTISYKVQHTLPPCMHTHTGVTFVNVILVCALAILLLCN